MQRPKTLVLCFATVLDGALRSLELYPRRLNSVWGAARAASRAGQHALASTFCEHLLDIAGSGSRTSVLDEARSGRPGTPPPSATQN